MDAVFQGELARGHEVRQEYHVPDAEQYSGAHFPFDIAHTGQWEFVEPTTTTFDPDPPRDGRVRTWHVDEIHPEGEWLPEVTEIRHNPGGNGVTEVGGPGQKRVDPTGHVLGMQTKGAIVVRAVPADHRMGPYAAFRARFMFGGGGWFYCYAGVSLRPQAYPAGSAIPESDLGWIVGMRRQLLEGKVVEPMARSVLDQHIRIHRNRLQRWTERMTRGEMDRDSYERSRSETLAYIERMTRAYDRQYGKGTALDGPVITAPEEGDAAEADHLDVGEPPSPTRRRR